LIAFYLPQFHPIAENDRWWGKGFTEWTNVTRAVPQFLGHYQPRLPDALGFYDLRVKDVQREQIRLAKKYGVYGFCYHYYWFQGRRLLERPLQQLLQDASLDFPFCICWANENWTRRWDGQDQEILIQQEYSPEDDLAFIADIAPAFKDSRYITIEGRPVLIVYRPQLFPEPGATADRWRRYARDQGLPEPYLINVHSFPEAVDPRAIGFDAALEFPPHQYPHREVTNEVRLLNEGFRGRIVDYRACVDEAEARECQAFPYRVFPGLMVGWDNSARRPDGGTVFVNANPNEYARWLATACRRSASLGQAAHRLVFLNAWNEWAEGAYLEPDRRYGFAYLEATKQTLSSEFGQSARAKQAAV
jgi:lipopolysaccharide biosynthesis protein